MVQCKGQLTIVAATGLLLVGAIEYFIGTHRLNMSI